MEIEEQLMGKFFLAKLLGLGEINFIEFLLKY